MYAIFETGGKQYTATVGDVLFIEKLDVDAGEKIAFNKVLAISTDGDTTFGAPYLDGAAITAKVVKNGRGKKITILTYRSKKDSKRKIGHRQPYTKVEILTVEKVAGKPVEDKDVAPKAVEAPKKAAPKKAAAPKKTAEAKPAAEKKPAAKKPAAKKAAETKEEK